MAKVPGYQYNYSDIGPPEAGAFQEPGIGVVTSYFDGDPNQPVTSGQTFDQFNDPDQARFLIPPNTFPRPFLANPDGRGGGDAFIFPLGIEGFDLNSSATLGIHHFIGDNDIDATVVYPDELHIVMDGLFPGHTGMQAANELRRIILLKPQTAGKVLYLPLVMETLEYVQVLSHRFTHSSDDRTRGVAYSVEFLIVGSGSKISITDPSSGEASRPGVKKPNKGSSARTYITNQSTRTLKTIAQRVYGSTTDWTKLRDKNLYLLYRLEIPASQLPIAQLPLGITLVI